MDDEEAGCRVVQVVFQRRAWPFTACRGSLGDATEGDGFYIPATSKGWFAGQSAGGLDRGRGVSNSLLGLSARVLHMSSVWGIMGKYRALAG